MYTGPSQQKVLANLVDLHNEQLKKLVDDDRIRAVALEAAMRSGKQIDCLPLSKGRERHTLAMMQAEVTLISQGITIESLQLAFAVKVITYSY